MIRAALVERPIDIAMILREVADRGCGATSLFVGTVRDMNDGRAVDGIDYEAYRPMAIRELTAIAETAAGHFGVAHLVVEHRIGSMAVGDVSVAIAASHAHRATALDATRHVIEEIKRRAPIWKREQYVDGTREWIDPARPAVKVAAVAEP